MITSRYPMHCLLISIALLQSNPTSLSVKSAYAFTTIVQPRHAGVINKRAVHNNALSNNPKSAILFHPSEHSRIIKRSIDTVTSLRQSDKNDDEDSSTSISIAQRITDLRKILAAKLISFFPTLRTAIASFTVGAIFALTVIFVPVYNSVDKMSEPVTLFETILTDLETGYVDDVDTKKLFETGVNAMLRSLDPYTEFESRQQSKDLTETIMGKYGGIGLVISGSTTKAKPVAVESSSTTISDKNGGSKILPTGAMEDNTRLNDISSSANSEDDDEDLIEDEFERAAMAKQRLEDQKEAAKGIRVVNAFEGYAFDYGMRPGDKLVAIDGWRIDNGSTVEDVRNKLRGDPGSDVEITFERDGVAGENTLKIQRTIVQIQDVKLASLVGKPEDGIGYIQLAGFSADAGREMRNSIFALQQAAERASGGETSLQGLVLDLRGNPGGLLTSAVDVSSLFVPKGSDIVSARGRGFAGVTYRSRVDPILDPKTKLAVLINDSTASAAEIVSGAVQDLDVGVIVGSSRSFGKGLVQNVEDLPFNTSLKFTVAKYYTPSGRCIQSVNYKEGGGSPDGRYQASKVAEKDKTVYYTTNGREVKDGGGIAVDYKVDAPKASALEVTLLRSGIISDFASDWSKNNELTNNFEVDDATYNSFKTFVMKQSKDGDLKLDSLYSRPIQDLKRSLAISGYKGSSRELEQLQASILNDMSKDFEKYKSDIKEDIATGILSRYLPESMLIDRSIKTDKQVLGAIKIIDDQTQFNKLLSRAEKDAKMLAKNTVEDSSFSDQNSAKINLKF
mmetsp:Transcript_16140/g.24189  ORF Transcript_16140/g.24189 Transcript_16140/m.24189 type:complete len:791 (-) Transcript_16140:107-2479(-)